MQTKLTFSQMANGGTVPRFSLVAVLLAVVLHADVIGASQYGDQCDQTNGLSCSSANLTCSNTSTCTCSPGFVVDDSKVVCVKKISYGEQCPPENFNPCNDTDTICVPDVQGTNRCICGENFYRNRNVNCSSVDDLAVSKISATSTTSKVTLTWTTDKHGLNASYSVTSDQGEGQLESSVTGTGAVWCNLTAGEKYSFKITTTVPADSIYDVKQVVVNKGDVWTESEKPGPVVSVTSLPGSPGQAWPYQVTFQPSPGHVMLYSLVINGEQVSGTNTTYTFLTLYPGQNCSYVITAFNGNQSPSGDSVGTFMLNTSFPGEIRNLTAHRDDDNALVLSFLCPDPRDVPGNVQGYRILKILLDSDGLPETNTSYPFPASRVSCANTFSDTALGGVLVERNYQFSVRAWNHEFNGNYSQKITVNVAPRVPKLSLDYSGSKLLQRVDNSGLKNTEFEVQVCSSCLLDSSRGTVLDAGLVVCVQGDGNSCTLTGVTKLSDIGFWDNSKQNGFSVPYLTTPSDWLTSVYAQPSGLIYIIGQDTSCTSLHGTSFCNGPLPSEAQITLIVVQCNVAGCGQVRYDGIFSTKGAKSDNDNLALALGLGIGLGSLVLVVVVVVVVVCCVKRKKKASSPYNKPDNPYVDEKYGYDKFTVYKVNPPPHRTLDRGLKNGYIDPVGETVDPYKEAPHDYENPDEIIYDYISVDDLKI